MKIPHQSPTTSHKSLIIGVDGNEANVVKRVGSNQYAFELLHALHDLPESKGHEWVVYLRDNPLPDMPRTIEGWHYKVFGPKYFWTQFALPIALFIGKRPDVFFTPGHYRPRFSPVPTVISIMDLGYLKFPDQFTKKDLLQLTRWTTYSIEKADHIITISESTKRDIIDYYQIPASKIIVTYPGYDIKNFQFPTYPSGSPREAGRRVSNFQINKVKKKYKIQNDYILFLGTLKPSKNVEGLLAAFSLITNHYPLVTLVIAGKKGWLYDSIFQKVKELGLEKQMIFTDFVADRDVPTLMAGAKVFVLPSFWEGFGIPVVEAMACGVPVVVSNVSSLPEVIGDAGVLVNPKDPRDIARGIKEAMERHDSLSKKGLAQVKKFSWEKCAKQTLEVLEKMVK